MVPTLYTSTSANFHLSRLNYILNTHAPFLNKNSNNLDIVSRDLEKLISSSKAYFSKMSDMRQKMMGGYDGKSGVNTTGTGAGNTNQEAKQDTTKKDTTTKQDIKKDTTTKQDTKKDTKQTPNTNTNTNTNQQEINPTAMEEALKAINDIRQKVADMDFKTFSLETFPDSFLYEDNPKPLKLKCLTNIYRSIYNQQANNNNNNTNNTQGDLIYLDVITLEGIKITITCSEKGFFINSSTENAFNAAPSPHPCFSYTLVGLLSQASQQFKENFSKLISQIVNVDSTMFLASPDNNFEWLKPNTTSTKDSFYNYRYKSFNSEMDSLKHMRLNKEWNEEYQAIIDLNFSGDPLQNLTKEKLLYDFYKMFKETAIEGTKLIREKKITPFNFFDNPRANSGYYMYGSIFFTVLEDNFNDFRTFTTDDQRQTCLGSNLDLRHINYINSIRHGIEIKDFYFSLNCIVQYKGLRVHAQVITPGVIFNSEHLVEYGEGEEGVIKYTEKFHSEYKALCEKLNIREIDITDKNGSTHKICGNPEIKGVRGVDKRKYLFDLIHLFPRDLNYKGADNNGCILRPELIKEYQLKLIHNKTSSDYEEELKKINSEAPSESIKDPQAYIQFVEEKYKKKEELFEKVNAEIKPDLIMNTTIGVESKYFSYKSEEYVKDEELLINLAKFLKEEMLKKFLSDISKDEENAPNDCFTITQYLHRYGIPCRYYGEIIRLIESDESFRKVNNWVKSLAVRDVLRRCAKHVYNNIAKDLPEYLVKEFTAYFLNIFLAPPSTIKALEGCNLVYENGRVVNVKSANLNNTSSNSNSNTNNTTVTSTNTNTKSKKKNKNKKKKLKDSDKTESEIELKYFILDTLSTSNKFFSSLYDVSLEDFKKFFIKPSEMWARIISIAQNRYGYKIESKNNFEYVNPVLNKNGLLRDFCLTLGIQIEAKEYSLYYDSLQSNQFKYTEMPFKHENILDFFPIVKDSSLPSEIHKPIFEQAEALYKAGSFIEAADKYKQVIYLSNEVYGQINQYAGMAHKKLGEISYLDGDYMNGIIMLQKSIIIFEKLYSYDTNIVANAYSELSTYYHLINQNYLAFKYISRGLEILNFTYPKNVSYIMIYYDIFIISILYLFLFIKFN